MKRIVAISDLHGHLPILPEADLVLIGGDFCCFGDERVQYNWMAFEFKRWLNDIKCPVIAVAGNHDWPLFHLEFPELSNKVKNLNLKWKYLEDSGTEVEGF